MEMLFAEEADERWDDEVDEEELDAEVRPSMASMVCRTTGVVVLRVGPAPPAGSVAEPEIMMMIDY